MAKTKKSKRPPGAIAAAAAAAAEAPKRAKIAAAARSDDDDDNEEEDEVMAAAAKAAKTTTTTTTTARKEEAAAPPPPPPPPSSTAEDKLTLLKQRFNALHELRMTQPEEHLHALANKAQLQQQAHHEHCAALRKRHSNELADLEAKHQAQLDQQSDRHAQLVDELRRQLASAVAAAAPPPATADASSSSSSSLKVIAILDCFKALTGMHVNLEDGEDEGGERRGTCTIFNHKTKLGVKFSLVIAPDAASIRFHPGANCKRLLPKELLAQAQQEENFAKQDVPEFVCKVQRALFLTKE